MAVEFYKCNVCGNVLAVITNGGGTSLTCCGKPMEHLIPGSTDAAAEKHVPVVEKGEKMLHVQVGSTPHPMLEIITSNGSLWNVKADSPSNI